MKIAFYHVDAFADQLLNGNPTAACVMPKWLPDNQLPNIAKENSLPVTALLVLKIGNHHIRWITEGMRSCGSANHCPAFSASSFS